MLFWILIAILTAVVAVLLVRPLALKREADSIGDSAREEAVYRDQMQELERERESGLINASEAENARAEIGRRLILAHGRKDTGDVAGAGNGVRRFLTVATIAFLPVCGLCLYLLTGSPGAPDQPLAVRLANPGNDMAVLVARAERHLVQNPEDGTGWDVLAPIYSRTGRMADAEIAYRNAIRLLGPSAERWTGLGETLVEAGGGIVTIDAVNAFARALELNPANPRARFYTGLAHEQAGRTQDAVRVFSELLTDSPAGSPWLPLVQGHLTRLGQAAGPVNVPRGPSADAIAAAQEMTQDDRNAMILGMVDGLEEKLRDKPDDVEGWERLIRSRMILGDRAKASDALKRAMDVFGAESRNGRMLVALASELGLPVDGGAK